MSLFPLERLDPTRFETAALMRQLMAAHRRLAELKGAVRAMPNQGVSRLTATSYLDQLVAGGFPHKRKIGRSNYYVNVPLFRLLTGGPPPSDENGGKG